MREGIKTSFLFLPEKEDPDSLIRKIGKSRFLNRAKNATPLSDFFFQKITDGKNIQSAEDSAEIARIAQENLQKMPNGIYKQLLLKKLSELLKIETSYSSKFDYLLKANPRKDRLAITQKPKDPRLLAISLLLNAPHLAHLVDCKENFEGEPEAYCTLLLELINLAKSQHNLTVGAILEYYRDSTHFELLNNLLSWEPLLTEEDLKNEFLGVIQLIKKSNAEKAIQDLLQKATNFGLTDEDKIKLQKLIAIAKQQ
jgi:DNA primase